MREVLIKLYQFEELYLISFHSLDSRCLVDLLKAGENLTKFIEMLEELGETH